MSQRRAIVEIDGYPINIATMDEAVPAILDRLGLPGSFLTCTLNLDHLVKLRTDPVFRDAYRRAELVTADGFPVVWLGRKAGATLERVTGADLIVPLCRAAAARSVPVFFLGTTLLTLCAASRSLKRDIPDLEIAGVYSPPLGFSFASPEGQEAVEMLKGSGAGLCFLALGAPRQEIFALHALDATNGVGFLGIGASLDFIAGTQTRCPELLRRLNLEWAWRALSDPRRLGPRYVQCALLFAGLVVKSLVTGGGSSRQA